jgi:hypothetical protein
LTDAALPGFVPEEEELELEQRIEQEPALFEAACLELACFVLTCFHLATIQHPALAPWTRRLRRFAPQLRLRSQQPASDEILHVSPGFDDAARFVAALRAQQCARKLPPPARRQPDQPAAALA